MKWIYIILSIGVVVTFSLSPIPQDPNYHNFADQRTIVGLPNFWNVISNLPFVLLSIIALRDIELDRLTVSKKLLHCYLVFFIAMAGVGVGSAYYHLEPNNVTLFWDRFPMTVGFMAFFTIIIGEFVSEPTAQKIFIPLLLLGAVSVIYWRVTEQAGAGDLRLYGLIQFAPILIIPMILWMFPPQFSHTSYIWIMLMTYVVAKLFEWLDYPVYTFVGLSGHAIKHAFAALGPYVFYCALKKRSVVKL